MAVFAFQGLMSARLLALARAILPRSPRAMGAILKEPPDECRCPKVSDALPELA